MTAETLPLKQSRKRDVRLDFFRGIGMFIILIAHITNNPWTLYIPARFGFSDATEMFIFCSGMASAIAFGTVFSKAGFWLGCFRVLHRMWQVYWVHIGAFFFTLVAMMLINKTGYFPRDEVGALNLYPFLKSSGANVIGLFTLTYVPNYFDILPDVCRDPRTLALGRGIGAHPRGCCLGHLRIHLVCSDISKPELASRTLVLE
jgi:hypothetical protein